MSLKVNNDVPTVYTLEKGHTVFVSDNHNQFVLKVANSVSPEEEPHSITPIGFVNTMRKVFGQSEKIDNGFTVTPAVSPEERAGMEEPEGVTIVMNEGQNCLIGMLDKDSMNFEKGVMISSFPNPNYDEIGLWHSTQSAEKMNTYSSMFGETNISELKLLAKEEQTPDSTPDVALN